MCLFYYFLFYVNEIKLTRDGLIDKNRKVAGWVSLSILPLKKGVLRNFKLENENQKFNKILYKI